MNIHFTKNNQTRFVKHGFSWQIFFFGPIAFVMRSQFLLAVACAGAMFATYMLTGFITIMVFDLDEKPALFFGVIAACSLVAYFGNRFSARSYVKNVTKEAQWAIYRLLAKRFVGRTFSQKEAVNFVRDHYQLDDETKKWYEQARLDAERALSLPDPSNSILDLQVYYLLSSIYTRLGKSELARKYIELSQTTPVPIQARERN